MKKFLQYARSQKSPTQDLVDFLIQANYLTEDVIAQVAASILLLPVVDLALMHIPQEVRELITPELARRFRAIPISDDGFSINIAIDDPLNLEKRMPQDGRIQMSIGGKQIDLRVSSVPSNHGESIVMRILDKSALALGLPQLGFFSDDEAVFDRLITCCRTALSW